MPVRAASRNEAALFLPAGTFARRFFRRPFLGGSVFGWALGLGLFVRFFLRSRVAGRSGRRRFLGVVGDVPAGALELDSRGGDHLLDLAATLGALLDHPVGE